MQRWLPARFTASRFIYAQTRDTGPVLNQKEPVLNRRNPPAEQTARLCLNKVSRQSGGLHMYELRGQTQRKHAGSKGLGGQHKGGGRLAGTAPRRRSTHARTCAYSAEGTPVDYTGCAI